MLLCHAIAVCCRDLKLFFSGNALTKRLREREREIEADERDRKKEKEEVEALRKKLLEENDSDPEAAIKKVSSYYLLFLSLLFSMFFLLIMNRSISCSFCLLSSLSPYRLLFCFPLSH